MFKKQIACGKFCTELNAVFIKNFICTYICRNPVYKAGIEAEGIFIIIVTLNNSNLLKICIILIPVIWIFFEDICAVITILKIKCTAVNGRISVNYRKSSMAENLRKIICRLFQCD